METHITDHALIRWLERVKGIDMDIIRAEMSSAAIDTASRFARGGECSVILSSGVRVLVRAGVVQTALPKRRNGR